MLVQKSIERCRAYRVAMGWSILRYAREAGLVEGTIRRMDKAGWSPNAKTLRILERIIPTDFQSPIEANDNGAAAPGEGFANDNPREGEFVPSAGKLPSLSVSRNGNRKGKSHDQIA